MFVWLWCNNVSGDRELVSLKKIKNVMISNNVIYWINLRGKKKVEFFYYLVFFFTILFICASVEWFSERDAALRNMYL